MAGATGKKRDFYKVLGVGKDATAAQIKSAFRKLARKYHPDVNKSPDSEQKFKEATEAYEVLSDPKRRKLYDQFGHTDPSQAGRGYQSAGQGFGVNFEDIFAGQSTGRGGFMGMSLDDILQALGGRRPGATRQSTSKRRGGDLEYEINIDFIQAINGTTTTVGIRRQDQRGGLRTETIEVKIPPGVADNQRIRVRGKGQVGPGGSGDLYIIVHVKGHPYFTRRANDIYVELPISITESALGATVDVPTIDGMTAVKIPRGTGSSKKLRLKGKGVSAGSAKGDQYVVIKIVPPQKLSDRQKKLLDELQSLDDSKARSKVKWK